MTQIARIIVVRGDTRLLLLYGTLQSSSIDVSVCPVRFQVENRATGPLAFLLWLRLFIVFLSPGEMKYGFLIGSEGVCYGSLGPAFPVSPVRKFVVSMWKTIFMQTPHTIYNITLGKYERESMERKIYIYSCPL